jgi:hypothetical protein
MIRKTAACTAGRCLYEEAPADHGFLAGISKAARPLIKIVHAMRFA